MNKNEKKLSKNEITFKNVLNSPLAKVALAASILVSTGTTAVGPASFIPKEVLGVQTAEAAVSGSYEYTVSNGQATIVAWNPKGYENANIPTHLGGYPVTAIGDYAFMSKWTNGFSIPSTVTSVGAYAFYDAEIEGTLTLPVNLKSVGENAFANNIITDLVIPNGLTHIGDFAFASNFLKTVSLKNVTSIGHYAFSSNGITSLTLPANLTSIGYGAFYFNRLTSITIPSKVTFVGADAFNYNALTSATILNPNAVVEDAAFEGNQSNPANLNIIGTDPSTAKGYALKFGHKFNGKILDVTPPSITLTSNVTTVTKGDVIVSANITDSASTISVKKWAAGNQNVSYFATGGTALGDSFTVSANNTYTVYAKDSSGNETVKTINITNIDKVAPVAATFVPSTTAATNNDVTVTVNFPSDAKTKEVSVNGGAWTPYTAALTFSANGTLKARSTDEAGNVSVEASLSINNIDKIAPTTPTLVADKTSVTNGNVAVTITYPSDSAKKEFSIDNGTTWSAYTSAVTMSANGSVKARATDTAGNVSTIGSLEITNIDKIAPTTPTLTADKTAVTNGNVAVTITYPSDSAKKEYSINNGTTWTTYTSAVTMSANGSVKARATDAAGNVSTIGSLEITNIDKVAPTTPTLTADKTAVTNGNVLVTITYPSDSAKKEYSINNGTTWTTYTSAVTMSANGSVKARATDAAGNVSTIGSLEITNIDKVAPTTPTLTADKTTATNGNVLVTIGFPSDSAKKEYSINNGTTWIAYTSAVTMSANGSVKARATDEAGNVSEIGTLNITNIDKVAPNAPTLSVDKTTATNGNVLVTVSYPSDSAKKEYSLDGTTWNAYTTAISMTANGSVKARATDEAGNVSAIGTLNITNIDKVAPNAPTLSADKTNVTNGNVVVTVAYPSDSAKKEYSVDNGTSWKAYTSAITMTANGSVKARATDEAGNVSAVGTLTVNNIDKVAPNVPTLTADKTTATNGNVLVTIAYPSDSAKKEYSLDGTTWNAYTTAISMAANGSVKARATDEAGNISAIGSLDITNIDKVAPNAPTLTADKTTATNGNVLVTVAYPSDSAKKEYSIDNGTSWKAYTSAITMSANGSVKARATDEAGNVSAIGTLNINNIDKVAPNVPTLTSSNTNLTNKDVSVTIAYPSDSVKNEFSLDDGNKWTVYTTGVSVATNGKVQARATDAAGNISVVGSLEIKNIDKTNPTVDKVEVVDSYLSLTTSDVGSTVASVEVKVGGNDWKVYQAKTIKIVQNTTVLVRVTDKAGNVTEGTYNLVSDEYFQELSGQLNELQSKLTAGGQTKVQLEEIKSKAENILLLAEDLVVATEKANVKTKASKIVSDSQNLLTALATATKVVNALGEKPTQAKINEALALVNALVPSSDKNALLETLKTKQNDRDMKDASKAVADLGERPTQEELNQAKVLVDALKDSTLKESLLKQIADHQKLIDAIISATKAVVKAETSNAQVDVNSAKTLVNALSNVAEKPLLLDRLDKVQTTIDNNMALKNAKDLVDNLGDAPTQSKIDEAKKAVNALVPSKEKESLLERLNDLQEDKDKEVAKERVENLGERPTQAELDQAKQLVNALPDGDVKDALLKQIEQLQKQLDAINEATNAVIKAEGSGLQKDVDSAKAIVNALTDIPEKADLLKRLDVIQTNIDNQIALDNAVTVVKALGENPTQAQLDEAKRIVSALSESAEKDNLLKQIDVLQKQLDAKVQAKLDLENATKLVDGLGDFPTQAKLDEAKAKVEALKDSKEKAELFKQLQDKQDLLDQYTAAEAKVVQAEKSKSKQDVEAAKTLVDALPDIPQKVTLTERLEKVVSAIEKQEALDHAKGIVDQLGDSPTQEELDFAKDVVNKLVPSHGKEELLKIIQEKQELKDFNKIIDKIHLLDKENPSQIELESLKKEIEALPDGPEKEQLLEELKKIQDKKDLEEAKKLVGNLGDNPTQAEIDNALKTVNDLSDSKEKADLIAIIEGIQVNLDKMIEEATKAVGELHEGSTLEELELAKELVNKLPQGSEKESLLEKAKEKEELIKEKLALAPLLERAESTVKHAEAFPTNFNIELAEKAISALPDGPEKISFTDRIETIKNNLQFEDAQKKVVQAERYERDPYLASAIQSVDALKDGSQKQELKTRLQAILDKLKGQQELEEEVKGDDGKFDPTNPNRSIEESINTIQDPEAKKFFTKWHKATNNASKFFSRAMTANATKVKEELPADYLAKASYASLIAELNNRTDNLAAAWQEASQNKATEQLFSKAYTLVDLYETSKNARNYNNAVAAIAELPDGVAKTAIQTQLASIKNHQEEVDNSTPTLNSKEAIEQTEKAVANYEKYKSSYYQKKAIELVGQLVDSEEKTAFQTRLDALAN